MGRSGLKPKILRFLSLAIVALLLAPFVAVQVQERMFRYRAGRLLSDIRALQLHKAGLQEIQAVFMYWNQEDRPRCCWFETDLWLGGMGSDLSDLSDWQRTWLRLFRRYGGRAAHLKAMAGVNGGSVWENFEIELETSPGPGPIKGLQDNLLSGETATIPRFSIRHDWHGLTLHAHYLVDEVHVRDWHPRTPDISVQFDSQADPKDIARLTKFDLSCLTRLWPCRRADELMPEAAAQYAGEEPQLARARKEHMCGPEIIGLMARNADYAGVVVVTRLGPVPGWGRRCMPTVRLIEIFKAGGSWENGQERGLYIFVDDDTKGIGIQANFPVEVHPDSRFILLAPTGQYDRNVLTVERCGIVPLNPENLQIVRHAIAENLPPTKP